MSKNKMINESLPKEQRLGQIGINNQGEKIIIIAYRGSEDIDIQFEDSAIVKNKRYGNFLRGKIAHPIRHEESFAYHIEVELNLDINKIWNFEKNTVSPYEITKQSSKKIWILCQDKDYHNDEGGYEITCANFYNGNRCGYCYNRIVHKLDSLGYLYPQIAQMIVNDKRNNVVMKDMYKIAPYSNIYFYFKCDKCKKSSRKKKILCSIIYYRFSCEYCSDNISISEKFMINILKQLNIKFIPQLTKTTFKWCKNYRYDFYIPMLNMIIETHGIQHYNGSFEKKGGRTLEEEQENDKLKKELALKNNIDNYIVIDCRHSEFNWLKENIIKELSLYFDLSNIDWKLAWEEGLKDLIWEIKRLYELGYNNKQIAKELNISVDTVWKYKTMLGIKNQYEIRKDNILKTKELLKQGYTVRQIAEILNVDRHTISSYKKEIND